SRKKQPAGDSAPNFARLGAGIVPDESAHQHRLPVGRKVKRRWTSAQMKVIEVLAGINFVDSTVLSRLIGSDEPPVGRNTCDVNIDRGLVFMQQLSACQVPDFDRLIHAGADGAAAVARDREISKNIFVTAKLTDDSAAGHI